MKKLLHNKSFFLILVLLIIIIAVLIISRLIDFKPNDLPEIIPSVVPAVTDLPTADNPSEANDIPAKASDPTATVNAEEIPLGYILVQSGSDGGWLPLPTGEDTYVTISQTDDDSIKNVIRLTQNGFSMDSSTCDNQDCVQQGEVTLENMNDRVLMNMVICLPHDLSIELYSIDELIEMMVLSTQQN